MNKQLLNDAFADINDVLIESAAVAPQRRSARLRGLATAAACAVLMLCCMFGIYRAVKVAQTKDDSPIAGEWVVVSTDGTTVEKRKTDIGGRQYALRIDYTPVIDLIDVKPDEEICGEMLGQWIISNATVDYAQYYSLFHPQLVNDKVYADFAAMGLDVERGLARLSAAGETAGLRRCELQYSILAADIIEGDDLNIYTEAWREVFESAGMQIDKVDRIAKYEIGEIRFCLNDVFLIDVALPELLLYRYEGCWYASHLMLDDSHRFVLESDRALGTGCYRTASVGGVVQEICGDYVRLEADDAYYLVPAEGEKPSVGETVEITYYTLSLECRRLSGQEACRVHVAQDITFSK